MNSPSTPLRHVAIAPNDTLASLYRGIGISAVAAALSASHQPSKTATKAASQLPAWLRGHGR